MSLRALGLALILVPVLVSGAARGQSKVAPMMKPAIPAPMLKVLKPSAVAITGFSGTFAVIIRGVTQYPVYAGEWVNMNGRGFGTAQGDRKLVVSAPDQDIVLQIQSWSDSQIVFHGPTMEQLGLDPRSRVAGAGTVTVAIKDPNGRFETQANQAFSGALCDRDEDGHGTCISAAAVQPTTATIVTAICFRETRKFGTLRTTMKIA